MSKGPLGRLTSAAPAPQPGTLLWRPWNAITKLNVKAYQARTTRRIPVLVLEPR